MHKRVHNPNPHISPRSINRRVIPDTEVSEGEDGADEVRRLLVQVVEILRCPLDVRREHFLHARSGEGWVGGDFVFG